MASRSSKFFQRGKPRKQGDFKRRPASKQERRRVLIVCEGEKTEPSYLRSLISHLGLTAADVEICGDCDSAQTSVVKFGEKKFNKDKDFDSVFFVFDRDELQSYENALAMVDRLKRS